MEAKNQSLLSAPPIARTILGALLLLVALSATGCKVIEHRVVYNPQRYPSSWDVPCSRELSGLIFEDVDFESLDGTRLHGWFVQPANMDCSNVVLFAHGRSGHVSTHKERLLTFVRRYQAAVFLFDYRGYGKSDGRPSEDGLYQDVTAARNWLADRMSVEISEVVLMGHSLGAATVIDLAARDGGKALIVESSFTSAPDVLKHHTRGLLSGSRLVSCFDSECKIASFSGPVFISHSIEDRALPYSQGVRLAQAATSSSRVQFMKLRGGHCSPPGEAYHIALGEFLNSVSAANRQPVAESRETDSATNSIAGIKY